MLKGKKQMCRVKNIKEFSFEVKRGIGKEESAVVCIGLYCTTWYWSKSTSRIKYLCELKSV
jgi:hypothetical protein